MRIQKVTYNLLLIIKETFRNRITLLLLLLIPAIFYFIAFYTTSEIPILIKIASAPKEAVIMMKPKNLGLIYIGLAATGFITSFMALNIMQKNTFANKRQILCGYNTFELSLSKLIFVICIVLVLGIYTGGLGLMLMTPKYISGVILGYILCGFVYGSFGLFIGAVLRKELEGILVIVLLTNLDIGWLQNPIYYSAAPNKFIIKLLPGFNPSQVSVISAFTDYSINTQIVFSVIYGLVFLILSMIIFRIRMRTYGTGITHMNSTDKPDYDVSV
jgi:hypothetical protein